MLNKKVKKISKKIDKKERIEILDFEKTTKYEKRKPKLKFQIKNKFKFSMVCLVIIAILLTGTSFITGKNVAMVGVKKVLSELGIYTEKISNVEIQSDDYNEPGSWHIDKSAKWTGSNKARVTFDVQSVMKTGDHYKDVILVLDVSGSMGGAKLEKAISDSKELVNYLLSNDKNRVAIVTFESASNIVSKFSNKKDDLLTKLDSITAIGCTNYNAALLNVDTVMEGYIKESNKDVVTLFLTDGYPNEDIPNQAGSYAILKDKYPYMVINGVQYEMGVDVIEEIKQITDSQWIADQSTLNNALFDASISPIVYEDFVVTDYIHGDYFKVNSVNDIKVTKGTVKLEEESGVQKVIWNLGKSFMTGGTAEMEINVILKEQYVGSEGFYPTNKKENITFKLPEENKKTVSSTSTPVLKNSYEVIYDTNAPHGCVLDSFPKEKYFIYQNVSKKTNELSCDGYLFKGWEFDEEDAQDITKVNDDVFVMPEHDVTIRGTWTKQAIEKTMDGMVHERITLYKIMADAAKEGKYARSYTGEHQDSMDGSGTEKIYYWYGSNTANKDAVVDKNNVIFAGYCWQMIRTTDTGGVKMIYNGLPDSNGSCLSTRARRSGIIGSNSLDYSLDGNYVYGTTYRYDETSKTFTLVNTETAKWSDATYESLIGKYTCRTSSSSCTELYQVNGYKSSTSAYLTKYKTGTDLHYSQAARSSFNANYRSLAMGGYMFGTVYDFQSLSNSSYGKLEIITTPVSQDEYNVTNNNSIYPYEYDEITKMWVSTNHTHSETGTIEFSPKTDGTYYLSYEVTSESNSDKMKIYLDNVLKTTVSGTNQVSSVELGALTTSSVVKVEYSKDSSISATGEQAKFSLAIASGSVDNRWLFGNDVEYKDGMYTLKDTVKLDLTTDYNSLNNNHYACLNEETKDPVTGEVSCANVKYIFRSSDTMVFYVELANGKKIEQAIKEMLTENKYNSSVKGNIDAWYEMNMMDYSDYLEDTIFCNDRTIKSLAGWDPNGGSTSADLTFTEYSKGKSLSCPNITDRFSVSNEKAKLKYKVGLISAPEMNLISDTIVQTGYWYWLLSPYKFGYFSNYIYAQVRYGHPGGYLMDSETHESGGVRPAISLVAGTDYTSGDGSREHPYIVE